MQEGFGFLRIAAVAAVLASTAIAPSIAQTRYDPPRTPDGKPDLQGTWTNASITTLERSDRYASTVLAPEDVDKATFEHPQLVRLRTEDIANTPATGLLTGKDLLLGRGYNAFWIDPGSSYANVKGTWRTSWIVDPPNGQVPVKKGVAFNPYGPRLGTGYDHPEERNLNERCIILGTSGPPIGNYLYNNNLRIIQSPNHVVIESEMIHDARIIPLNAEHKPKELTPWMGDSIGWWEGDTLVVETINMTRGGNQVQLSPAGKIIERFSRYNDKQVFYEFEVHDPSIYSQVWKGQMSLNAVDGMYEYACHEGNHGLIGILEGGRTADREGRDIREEGDREE